eukprot:scaffold1135_cov105-Cylindrotheca_fusiformis.AAC.2
MQFDYLSIIGVSSREPMPRPEDDDAVILLWVWTYLYKTDPKSLKQVPKARGTCNGGPRFGKIITLADTYAVCVEQPAHQLTWSLVAALNYIAIGADVGNAFAEAAGPKDGLYMEADDAFREWWTEHMKQPPIPRGYVVPILCNIQGHPKAPRFRGMIWRMMLMLEKLWFEGVALESRKEYSEAGMPSWRN